jgi:hypothetical protein
MMERPSISFESPTQHSPSFAVAQAFQFLDRASGSEPSRVLVSKRLLPWAMPQSHVSQVSEASEPTNCSIKLKIKRTFAGG